MPSPYPSARVAVNAETWDAFKLLALRRGIALSTYLGRLVEAETKRRHAPGVERIDPHAPLEDQALNALAAVHALVGIDAITRIVKVVGFVASAPGFHGQPGVVNGASELLGELFGEAGQHVRSAVGVASLPKGTPVELELTVQVRAEG